MLFVCANNLIFKFCLISFVFIFMNSSVAFLLPQIRVRAQAFNWSLPKGISSSMSHNYGSQRVNNGCFVEITLLFLYLKPWFVSFMKSQTHIHCSWSRSTSQIWILNAQGSWSLGFSYMGSSWDFHLILHAYMAEALLLEKSLYINIMCGGFVHVTWHSRVQTDTAGVPPIL